MRRRRAATGAPSRTPQVVPPAARCACRRGCASSSANQPMRAIARGRRRARNSNGSSALSTSTPSGASARATVSLTCGQVVEVVDAVFAEMVRADVGDHRGARVADRDAAAQQAAARGFQDRRLDARLAQHGARADRAGVVAAVDALAADEHAVGAAVAAASSPARAPSPRAGARWWSCRWSR